MRLNVTLQWILGLLIPFAVFLSFGTREAKQCLTPKLASIYKATGSTTYPPQTTDQPAVTPQIDNVRAMQVGDGNRTDRPAVTPQIDDVPAMLVGEGNDPLNQTGETSKEPAKCTRKPNWGEGKGWADSEAHADQKLLTETTERTTVTPVVQRKSMRNTPRRESKQQTFLGFNNAGMGSTADIPSLPASGSGASLGTELMASFTESMEKLSTHVRKRKGSSTLLILALVGISGIFIWNTIVPLIIYSTRPTMASQAERVDASEQVTKNFPSTVEVSGGEIPALRGFYKCIGTHTMCKRRPIYRKDGEVSLEIYYWDAQGGNGQEPGWWIGGKTGGSKVVAFNVKNDMLPPEEGWRVPWNGPEDMSVQVRAIANGD